MNTPLKILLSAYSCGPNRGSEPGVGWNAAMALAQHAEVHVLTTSEFQSDIEAEMAAGRVPPTMHFHFHEFPLGRLVWRRKNGLLVRAHYTLWQRSAAKKVRRLHRAEHFTSAQHLTFVRYWSPSCLAGSGIPYVFGPVGGAEFVPPCLSAGFPFKARVFEKIRNLIRWCSEHSHGTRKTLREASFVLATTRLSAEHCARIRGTESGVSVFGESALNPKDLSALERIPDAHDAVRFCGLGRLVPLKRYDLAVRAFARASIPDAELRLVGGGPEADALQTLAETLGVAKQVSITGFLPRAEALAAMKACDVMIHPSTHDSGGWACVEAMGAGLPVVCLDWGGPGTQVTDETGYRIPIASEDEVVAHMADALRTLADPAVRKAKSDAAARLVRESYIWDAKAAYYLSLHQKLAQP